MSLNQKKTIKVIQWLDSAIGMKINGTSEPFLLHSSLLHSKVEQLSYDKRRLSQHVLLDHVAASNRVYLEIVENSCERRHRFLGD